MSLTLLQDQLTDAVEKISASVVSIRSVRYAMSYPYEYVPIAGAGSGVIIDSKGYILTNNHVVDGAEKVKVETKDGRVFDGSVVGGDAATDIALVKIKDDRLAAAELGDSDGLKQGQIALAVGNALGLAGGLTVSAGVISALGRPLRGMDFIFDGLIQTDAAVNPGNSGGALADISGKVVGINTAMIPYAQGMGFAIPINTARHVAHELMKHGAVRRPWIGISVLEINAAIARRFDLTSSSGILVADVSSNSPADDAGLMPGDVIKSVADKRTEKTKDLLAVLQPALNKKVAVVFERNGRTHKTYLKVTENGHDVVVW